MQKQFGWLDATIFVHVLFRNDPHRERCMAILKAIENGEGEGWLDPIVVHELTYVLPRALPTTFAKRSAVSDYILGILLMENMHAVDKNLLVSTLDRWSTMGIGFADARLASCAEQDGLPVCSVNERDFPDLPNTF